MSYKYQLSHAIPVPGRGSHWAETTLLIAEGFCLFEKNHLDASLVEFPQVFQQGYRPVIRNLAKISFFGHWDDYCLSPFLWDCSSDVDEFEEMRYCLDKYLR